MVRRGLVWQTPTAPRNPRPVGDLAGARGPRTPFPKVRAPGRYRQPGPLRHRTLLRPVGGVSGECREEVAPRGGWRVTRICLRLDKQRPAPADVSASVAGAGGSLVQAYDEIGVAIAASSNARFREQLIRDSRVQDV